MASYYNKNEASEVRRHAERGRYDAETIEQILDEGLVGHLAFVAGGRPYATPMLYARAGDRLYLHGSPLSRLLAEAGSGTALCFTVTLLDGLVLARSAFHHSVNYRSVMLQGEGRSVSDRVEKLEALRLIVEQIVRGRSADARGPSDGELKATEVVAMTISAASAKVRNGPPADSRGDHALPVWAGVLPLSLRPGAPVPDERCDEALPAYLSGYRRTR